MSLWLELRMTSTVVRSSLALITTHQSNKINSNRVATLLVVSSLFVCSWRAASAAIPICAIDRPQGQKFAAARRAIPPRKNCENSIVMHGGEQSMLIEPRRGADCESIGSAKHALKEVAGLREIL
jgi:hypothetical protein